jgi:hypothetical protein
MGHSSDKVEFMASSNPKKKPNIATVPAVQRKSAEEELLESFGQLIDEAGESMTDDEFLDTAEKSKRTLDRAIAVHSRRRGTA